MASEVPRAPELSGYGRRVALLRIDCIVHLTHFRLGHFSAQCVERRTQLWVVAKSAAAKNRHGLVGREKMAVIFEDDHSERDDEPIGRTAGDHIYLMFLERPVKQTEIHDVRRRRELQAIDARQTWIAVRAFHELVAESGAPLRRMRNEIRDSVEFELLRVFTANHDGKGIVESKRRTNFKSKTIAVGIANLMVDRPSIIGGRFA